MVAYLDLFKNQLSLDDLLYKDKSLLYDLYQQRIKYLEEKQKAEKKEMEKIRNQNPATKSHK